MGPADKPLTLALSTAGWPSHLAHLESRKQQLITNKVRTSESTSRLKWHPVAESLPNAAKPGEASAATVGAELQFLLAEAKRLSMQQELLKQEVNDINTWEAKDAAAKSNKARGVPKLNGCKMKDCSGPVMTVPFGRQCTAGSSDWSEAATETPVRNVISGVCSVLLGSSLFQAHCFCYFWGL